MPKATLPGSLRKRSRRPHAVGAPSYTAGPRNSTLVAAVLAGHDGAHSEHNTAPWTTIEV